MGLPFGGPVAVRGEIASAGGYCQRSVRDGQCGVFLRGGGGSDLLGAGVSRAVFFRGIMTGLCDQRWWPWGWCGGRGLVRSGSRERARTKGITNNDARLILTSHFP